MPRYFLDSSALVKGYRIEEGTPRIHEILNGSDPLVIARLTEVEVSSAIVRRGRSSRMPITDINLVLAQLDRDTGAFFEIIELTAETMIRAVGFARSHGLRGADSVQLACALAARDAKVDQQLIFVASDKELNAAALAEGISVLNPVDETH